MRWKIAHFGGQVSTTLDSVIIIFGVYLYFNNNINIGYFPPLSNYN